jgi:hypothetical protein
VLYEDHVVDAVCAHLEAEDWRIESRAHAHQHGDDIVAVRGDERLVVEAKGAGSSKAGTRRYGLAFNRGQVKSHVGVAVLRALGVASDRTALSAVAFPDDRDHRDVAGRIVPALADAQVGVFWVDPNHRVTAELPWSPEP